VKIRLVCLEDGITSCGFRKIAAFTEKLNADTQTCYVSTDNYRSIASAIRGTQGASGELLLEEVDEIAQELLDADLLGFSSMTGYAEPTRAVIRRIRELGGSPYIIWGGIHPIIHPEDAIQADVDAVCTGEGELAMEELLELFKSGKDFTGVRNFWFKHNGRIQRNGFRPLMTSAQMEELPFPKYGDGEWIYRRGRGLVPLTRRDFLATNGLCYTAIWSIGCPFRCSFCGNTKFIANDPKYRKIRHPSARYIVEEVKIARQRFPHISTVGFHDDSFMAIPYRDLEEFAVLWREEVGIPFAVYGVIPNYVRNDKFELLTWAGMNRVRMGLQSGSERILDFYNRPSSIESIEQAARVITSYVPRFHIPPNYDVIMDNPVETRQDVVDTLELFYRLARPFNLFVFSLKVIPNTELAREMDKRGIDLEGIDANYQNVPFRMANVMLYLLALCRPPRWIFERLLRRVEASGTPQKTYPMLGTLLKTLYLTRRAMNHLRFMDFSIIPGHTGYVFWKLGIVGFWREHLTPRPPRCAPAPRATDPVLPAEPG
jgi:radical SAM superfamily enzyme YgiQ (UPF0313 family)